MIGAPAVAKLFVDDSQRTTVPTLPDKVKVPEFVGAQTVVDPAIVPPTEAGVTVTVATLEVAEAHEPLCTIAL